MKTRMPILMAVALATVAVVFLARRPTGSHENTASPATTGTASDDKTSRPDPGEYGGRGTIDRSPSPVVTPTGRTTASSVAPRDSSQPQVNPFPANKPVVVGSRIFVPKEPPPPPDPQTGIALDKVRSMLRDYRTLYRENPVGTNAEIMKAVMGGNPKQARLGPPDDQSLSPEGELLDRWGTPYFFHQLSSDLMEIRSAGPDKSLWTSDDIVTK